MKRLLKISLRLIGLCAIATVDSSLQAVESAALLGGVPVIQFETNFFDFGSITTGETLAGVFKFKNVGSGTLKVSPPEASCDCTEPRSTTNTLAPGENAEIRYTIKLDHALSGQRLINVHSNDPKTPDVRLTIQLDYTPLYTLNPKALKLVLPAGKQELVSSVSVSRTDGKLLDLDHLTTSQEWVSATFDPLLNGPTNSARVKVTLRRPAGPPAPFEASVQIWGQNKVDQPVQTLRMSGEILGEVAAIPARLYWVIPDLGKNKADYPAEALRQKIELVSVLGHEVELKSATTSIEGMNVKIVPRKAGQTFDLLLTFDELPKKFANGKVTVATSLASLPELEVPISVAVPESN